MCGSNWPYLMEEQSFTFLSVMQSNRRVGGSYFASHVVLF
jgi:hypothetical protein